MSDKTLTAAKVRAILRKSGLTAAKSHTTQIRGWHSWTSGYLVREFKEKITVEYMTDHSTEERKTFWLGSYENALLAAGLSVQMDQYQVLVVRGLVLAVGRLPAAPI